MILDLLLPTVNGFEILREVKNIAPGLLAKTIVVTAAAESTFRDCEEISRVFAVMRKPFDVQGLEDQLLRIMSGGRGAPHRSPNSRASGTMRLKIG